MQAKFAKPSLFALATCTSVMTPEAIVGFG
jgi:hypothetical protein